LLPRISKEQTDCRTGYKDTPRQKIATSGKKLSKMIHESKIPNCALAKKNAKSGDFEPFGIWEHR
jgi:hypothetical protein